MLISTHPFIKEAVYKCHEIINKFQNNPKTYPGEEDITSRLLERISDGTTLKAGSSVFESSLYTVSKNVEEPRIGADALIILNFESDRLNISHSMLVQAKVIKSKKSIGSKREMCKLRKQCHKMLSHTDHSHIWIYDRPETAHEVMRNEDGSPKKYHFKYMRASLVRELQTIYPDDIYHMPLHNYFENILKGNIGGKYLRKSHNYKRLESIIQELGVENILMLRLSIGPDLEPSSEVVSIPPSEISEEMKKMTRDFYEEFNLEDLGYKIYKEDLFFDKKGPDEDLQI